MKDKYYAVIDIGSNSVRLMIHDGNVTLSKEICSSKLAKNMQNDILDIASIDRTVEAISYFVDKASVYTDNINVFATEALRKASNKNILVDKVKNITGIDVNIISGEEEAKIGFVGAAKNNDCTIVDIGGASTEIVSGNNGKIEFAQSMPVGAVVLSDNCLEKFSSITKYLKKYLLYGKVPFKNDVIAIGGTATTVAAIVYHIEPYDREKVNGSVIERKQIINIMNKIKCLSNEERLKVVGLQKGREDIIVGAMYELLYIMDMLQVIKIRVSDDDNLEGYLYEYVIK